MYVNLNLILAGMLLLASAAFAVLAMKFWSLRDTVIFSIKEMGELMVLLARYDDIERPEETLARMLKMTPDEVLVEIEKGRIMKLISMKAAGILEALKTSVPEARQLIRPYENQILAGR